MREFKVIKEKISLEKIFKKGDLVAVDINSIFDYETILTQSKAQQQNIPWENIIGRGADSLIDEHAPSSKTQTREYGLILDLIAIKVIRKRLHYSDIKINNKKQSIVDSIDLFIPVFFLTVEKTIPVMIVCNDELPNSKITKKIIETIKKVIIKK